MRQRLADYRVFWRQFRQAYNSTGAVLPSGRGLARALAHFVRTGEAASAAGKNGANSHSASPLKPRRILEVGPGTGAVTIQIVRNMRPDDQLVLVERNDEFVAHLRSRLANEAAFAAKRDQMALVHSTVEDLPEDEPFDLIISGLPLNNFSVELVDQILTKLDRILSRRGTVSFFEYVAVRTAKAIVSPRTDRERLRGIASVLGKFLQGEVRRDLVLANVPPAWVHHVRKCNATEVRP
jgi:phosphatidylethanolamine/phosphatidyl-N-methylethanolamine N-methyltransferase